MAAVRWLGFANPSRWYLAMGLALLVASLWVPFATAGRTTRIEGRADDLARALRTAVGAPLEPLDAADVETVLARMYRLTERDQIYTADLERVDPPWPGTVLALRNKHYLFHLAESPPGPRESPSAGAVPAYEVMAWPRRRFGPANAVFFHPDNAISAYTRNLAQGYAGEDASRPPPGSGQRRAGPADSATSYRGVDDGRWIAHRALEPL